MIAPAGTPVLAVEDGVIIRGPYKFVRYTREKPKCDSTTYAIDVLHQDFLVRYAEIAYQLPPNVFKGAPLDEGQVIAFVGAQCGGSMLHFEMFKDANNLGVLTDPSNDKYLHVLQANYQRRSDLMDPTRYLDKWPPNCRKSRSNCG